MRAFLDKNARRIAAAGFGFFAPAAVLVALFFGEALASEEAYAELGYAVAFISTFGSAACAGYLAFFVLRIHAGDPGLWTAIRSFPEGPFDAGTSSGEEWPLLITLLFRKIPALFAGLAGWVEARA